MSVARRFIFSGLVLVACGHTAPTASPPAAIASSPSLVELEPLAEGVWLHRTTHDEIPANGLVVATADDGALLVDTGWSDADGLALLAAVHDRLGRTVTDAIVTHSHDDRVGGVRALVAHGVHIHAGTATAAKMVADGLPAPDDAAASPAARTIGGVDVEIFFPGAGHTRDNVVVWLPATKIVFGGCFVKSPAATDLGNIADAELAAWPASIAAVRARYPQAAIIVPGHGPITGDDPAIDGLARTAALLAAP
ncbi:MAG: subclass B1 metallo-beta-lactamase [Deltaproteobacteria bacterium]|nr:subclass B1 metallo-beta-lactamase [Deltaproteobacteria bacterium]